MAPCSRGSVRYYVFPFVCWEGIFTRFPWWFLNLSYARLIEKPWPKNVLTQHSSKDAKIVISEPSQWKDKDKCSFPKLVYCKPGCFVYVPVEIQAWNSQFFRKKKFSFKYMSLKSKFCGWHLNDHKIWGQKNCSYKRNLDYNISLGLKQANKETYI